MLCREKKFSSPQIYTFFIKIIQFSNLYLFHSFIKIMTLYAWLCFLFYYFDIFVWDENKKIVKSEVPIFKVGRVPKICLLCSSGKFNTYSWWKQLTDSLMDVLSRVNCFYPYWCRGEAFCCMWFWLIGIQ